MPLYNTYTRHQHLGAFSTYLGILGILLFWWNPAGMVVSLAGLVLALIGWVMVREETSRSWLIAGTILCCLALFLDLLAAAQGWTFINLTWLD